MFRSAIVFGNSFARCSQRRDLRGYSHRGAERSHTSATYGIAKQFSAIRREAKIPKGVVLYSAGHSFATDMLDRTGNIVLVGKMLGHSSVTTTQRYLHPEIKGLAELVNERNALRVQKQNQ